MATSTRTAAVAGSSTPPMAGRARARAPTTHGPRRNNRRGGRARRGPAASDRAAVDTRPAERARKQPERVAVAGEAVPAGDVEDGDEHGKAVATNGRVRTGRSATAQTVRQGVGN